MPQSTVLSSPPPRYDFEWEWPPYDVSTDLDDLRSTSATQIRPSNLQRAGGGVSLEAGVTAIQLGGDNVGPNFNLNVANGRLASFLANENSQWAAGYKLPWWAPLWDPLEANPGARIEPASVVAVIDWHFVCETEDWAGSTADASGFWFQPHRAAQPGLAAGSPGGASPTGGFGIAINDDGSAKKSADFVAYNAAGVVLQRTPLSIALFARWNVARFIIVSAVPGGAAATLSLEINGAPIVDVTSLEFDDVTLLRPTTLFADALGFVCGLSWFAMGAAPFDPDAAIRFRLFGRHGRFLPNGLEAAEL